ncbi:flocculation protein FLO11-like isoform X4 [Drosophila serrata]|uniref:flocculation protein FLO11-like isoform X4 n=1 Tax=Drosophila serrata TaxID=7274 RepID=UPI000A1D38AA|nr:flocculation protein FLO11-like isoform X4 [Drosophila serrata]
MGSSWSKEIRKPESSNRDQRSSLRYRPSRQSHSESSPRMRGRYRVRLGYISSPQPQPQLQAEPLNPGNGSYRVSWGYISSPQPLAPPLAQPQLQLQTESSINLGNNQPSTSGYISSPQPLAQPQTESSINLGNNQPSTSGCKPSPQPLPNGFDSAVSSKNKSSILDQQSPLGSITSSESSRDINHLKDSPEKESSILVKDDQQSSSGCKPSPQPQPYASYSKESPETKTWILVKADQPSTLGYIPPPEPSMYLNLPDESLEPKSAIRLGGNQQSTFFPPADFTVCANSTFIMGSTLIAQLRRVLDCPVEPAKTEFSIRLEGNQQPTSGHIPSPVTKRSKESLETELPVRLGDNQPSTSGNKPSKSHMPLNSSRESSVTESTSSVEDAQQSTLGSISRSISSSSLGSLQSPQQSFRQPRKRSSIQTPELNVELERCRWLGQGL